VNQMNDLLVVEDNPVLVSVLSEIFNERGYIVRTATDGFAALATIRSRVPGILMSDLNMPRMSGFELLSIVRRRFPMIAVIAMSGAYSGVAVPSGVAADGFYAKGSSSVARLFEILYSIRDEATRHSLRETAPIWVHHTPILLSDLATIALACPECLRTFSHSLHTAKFLRAEGRCPHCQHLVQLAIVGPMSNMDQTNLRIPDETAPHTYAESARKAFRSPPE
jgi:CheY-like chemotaxis protein